MKVFDDGPYDLDGNGIEDDMEMFVGMQLFAGSRQEALDRTGDDSFYLGDDFEDNGFHDEYEDTDDFDDSDEYDDVDPEETDDWD